MNRKITILAVGMISTLALISSCSTMKSKNGVSAIERVTLAKQYAMGSVLNFALKQEGFTLSDNDVSLPICVEVGDLPLALTNSIDKMAGDAAKSIKPSQIGDYDKKKPIVKDCVAFMNSKPVADTIRKYLKM